MEEITLSVVQGGEEKSLRVPKGQNLLRALREAGFSVQALCGERGVCGSCKVQVLRGQIAASEADEEHFSAGELSAGWRLSCMAYPDADIAVLLPASGEDHFSGVLAFAQPGKAEEKEQSVRALQIEKIELAKDKESVASRTGGSAALDLSSLRAAGRIAAKAGQVLCVTRYGGRIVRISEAPEKLYAIGVDIGTTTVGMALVDLQSASVAGRHSAVNRQREHGADVVTRIVKAKGGSLALLSGLIRTQLAEGISALCRDNEVPPQNVVKVAIAGNTTMLHLLLELSCDLLGNYPFTPVTLDHLSIPFRELLDGELSCPVDILPGISTYVGADITAGLLSTMMHRQGRPCILLDIGTNGEMALSAGGSILCTSTAAGPALEGVNITWGTGSIPGAISSIRYEHPGFSYSTVGGKAPVGICGSGVIDGVYQCLKNGLISQSGRFQGDFAAKGAVIAKNDAGEEICLNQKDIREVQLAKSAIRAGLEVLINRSGLRAADIDTLYVAGGFGYNIDFNSGVGIGLVPRELEDKIKLIGNSALGGTVSFLLNPELRKDLDEIARVSSEFSLSEDKSFDRLFIAHMAF